MASRGRYPSDFTSSQRRKYPEGFSQADWARYDAAKKKPAPKTPKPPTASERAAGNRQAVGKLIPGKSGLDALADVLGGKKKKEKP